MFAFASGYHIRRASKWFENAAFFSLAALFGANVTSMCVHAENQLKSLKSHLAERIAAINSRKKNRKKWKNAVEAFACDFSATATKIKHPTNLCVFSHRVHAYAVESRNSLSSNAMQRAPAQSNNFTE